jgi:methyl-accepting chemotaxis protein
MLKKIYSFIKKLFVKIDKLEEQAEVLIDKSAKYAPGLASDAKKALNAIDEIEEKLEAQIDESQSVAEKIEKAIKTKNMSDATDAYNSSKDFVEDTKKEIQEVKNKIKTIKK